MGAFHVFKILQTVLNRATHHNASSIHQSDKQCEGACKRDNLEVAVMQTSSYWNRENKQEPVQTKTSLQVSKKPHLKYEKQ